MSRRSGGGGRNRLLVQGAEMAVEQMKYEIAAEFGIQLGAEQVSRANGSVGGEITKRLVATAQSQLAQAVGQPTGPSRG
ncbi:small acid-soluble spore protein [Peribacillus saganii]|uniref:Small acid-soluble spore protein n=1 Tax=Peribacillus saganii TaxID=2303992 RepID=A0A372LSJ9_9BACI|nr:alpha/beta-type small acid-soluble spore protein [Peribacillus saganii]RFU70790.1 small acid-soluble spore protein [Peribacillus saganii]